MLIILTVIYAPFLDIDSDENLDSKPSLSGQAEFEQVLSGGSKMAKQVFHYKTKSGGRMGRRLCR
ncbi:hypothetical protein HED54_09345 [Ochrobactrum anthropi ATCC 49188]|nr:hypothetical protein [Brucella anthropi ATCC 49188]